MKTKIAVIQLTRIGDLVQTLQATRQFKAENPNAEFTLIARRKFAKGIGFLLETVFDHIVLFETKDFFIDKTLSSAKSELSTFLFNVNKTEFDFCVNLTFSKSSSYLASCINAKHYLGPVRNSRSEIQINDKWSQYLYSNVLNGTNVPFNLVDLYRYILGVNENLVLDPDPNFQNRANNIVIHPFASQRKKKWGISKWNELIYKLAKDFEDYQFHIVGGNEDKAEAARMLNSPALSQYKDRIHNHTVKSSIADVYQLLMNTRLFIGHDSMVSHLASETLTPSIVLSLGTVRPNETSPYGNKVITIAPGNKCFPCPVEQRCDLLPCHNSINHQVVNTIATGLIQQKEINQDFLKSRLSPLHMDSVRIYRSEYSDEGIDLNLISNHHNNIQEVFKQYYKIIWLYYLRGVESNSELPNISKETAAQLSEYTSGVNYLFELYNFGVTYANRILDDAKEKEINFKVIQENINKLGEIDQLCNVTKKNYPLLQGLVDYFYVNKANAIGNNLVEVTQNNLLIYYDASNLVAVINDFVEKSISPHMVQHQERNKEV